MKTKLSFVRFYPQKRRVYIHIDETVCDSGMGLADDPCHVPSPLTGSGFVDVVRVVGHPLRHLGPVTRYTRLGSDFLVFGDHSGRSRDRCSSRVVSPSARTHTYVRTLVSVHRVGGGGFPEFCRGHKATVPVEEEAGVLGHQIFDSILLRLWGPDDSP